MGQRSATEHTEKFATTVDEMTDAFVFIMEHLDRVGNSPSVQINPSWSSEDDFQKCYYEVSISGMTEL